MIFWWFDWVEDGAGRLLNIVAVEGGVGTEWGAVVWDGRRSMAVNVGASRMVTDVTCQPLGYNKVVISAQNARHSCDRNVGERGEGGVLALRGRKGCVRKMGLAFTGDRG